MAICETCSAPLPPNRNTCDYCGTRNDVDLKGIHQYTVNKPETERICPCCNVKMQSLDLKIDGNFYIERCEKCMGMFFDPGELETILDKSVSKVFNVNIDKIKNLSAELDEDNFRVVYRKCPVCGELMNRINFGASSGVIIDRCRSHGVWLDGGELKRLLEWKKAGGQIHEARKKSMMEADQHREEKRLSQEKSQSMDSMNSSYSSSYEAESNIIASVMKFVSQLF